MKLRQRVFHEDKGLGHIFCIGIVYDDEPFREGSNYYVVNETPVPMIDVKFDNGEFARFKGNEMYGVLIPDG